MSFMKKVSQDKRFNLIEVMRLNFIADELFQMVAQEETPQQSANENSGTTFGKLKALSSSLLTAQDKGK